MDADRLRVLRDEYGDYDENARLGAVYGTATIGEFLSAINIALAALDAETGVKVREWPGDDLDQLVSVLETIEYIAHNDIRAHGMKAIWDFARYAQGFAPRIRSALVPPESRS